MPHYTSHEVMKIRRGRHTDVGIQSPADLNVMNTVVSLGIAVNQTHEMQLLSRILQIRHDVPGRIQRNEVIMLGAHQVERRVAEV